MGTVCRLALAFFWLVPVPAVCGQLFSRSKRFSWAESWLTGILFLFSLAQVLILPMMVLRLPLHVLAMCYGALVILAAAVALRHTIRVSEQKASLFRLPDKEQFSWYLAAALLLIALQLFVVFRFGHFDQDDAFYVGAATTAVHTDTIFEISAYTGLAYRKLLSRYVLSLFPVFLAVISRLSLGLHPATLAHMLFAPVFLAGAYLAVWQLARTFYPADQEARGLFLLFSALLYWFSGYASRNPGSFILLRAWQGKAILAGVLLPYSLALCIRLFFPQAEASASCNEQGQDPADAQAAGGSKPGHSSDASWIQLFLAGLAATHITTMGILLFPLLVGVCYLAALLLRTVTLREGGKLLKTFLCCVPSLLFGIAYLLIS